MNTLQQVQAIKARQIAHQLGYRSAAGYLRNRGWALQDALQALLNAEVRSYPQPAPDRVPQAGLGPRGAITKYSASWMPLRFAVPPSWPEITL